MTTPKRWIDEQSDADAFERAVLRSGLEENPPSGAEADVFTRVMAAVAPGGLAAGHPAPAAPATGALGKGATTLVGLGKGFVLGVGVSVAVVAGGHFLRERAPENGGATPLSTTAHAGSPVRPDRATPDAPPRSPVPSEDLGSAPIVAASARAQAKGAVPEAASAATAASVAEPAPGGSSVASFPASDGALAASRLKEEAAMLGRARAELKAGALAAAFATLEASRREFAAPELVQERESLTIELLHRSGERAAAAARAREFLRRFPDSPHGAVVRAFADDGRH